MFSQNAKEDRAQIQLNSPSKSMFGLNRTHEIGGPTCSEAGKQCHAHVEFAGRNEHNSSSFPPVPFVDPPRSCSTFARITGHSSLFWQTSRSWRQLSFLSVPSAPTLRDSWCCFGRVWVNLERRASAWTIPHGTQRDSVVFRWTKVYPHTVRKACLTLRCIATIGFWQGVGFNCDVDL